jgi:hypothetical protein
MIIYNMPYRAPFNYDKTALNALQLNNYMQYEMQKISDELNSPQNLIALSNQVDAILASTATVIDDMFIQTLDIKG